MRKSSYGIYPHLLEEDIMVGATVTMWRNPANKKFKEEDVAEITCNCDSLSEIGKAYETVLAREKELSEKINFAWDSEFGYLSPIPEHCGTALQFDAEFHLEALHLMGDLPPVLNALEAVRFAADSISKDGINQAAHLFRVRNCSMIGISEKDLMNRSFEIFKHLLIQESNARRALVEEMPRILEDAISRSLAILRSARLLSPGELLDILSPIKLGVTLGFIDGLSRTEVWDMMNDQLSEPPAPPSKTLEDDRKRDARDAKLADKTNKFFANVKLNKLANEYFK